jgi:hypothetical protein
VCEARGTYILKSGTLQTLYFGGHGGTEEVCVSSVSWDHFENLVEHWTEIQIKQAVCLIEDQVFQVLERETLGIFEMIE